ncbi:MAG: hypothetical protein NUV94_04335 [Candidatus Acetothermia bacterium]|jgi:chromatin segregation and condensation protein Rec8/ScpA/Scc1 (kleisin family)|nr:hypothetical protein [Candidatus Acetothermia bacterium]
MPELEAFEPQRFVKADWEEVFRQVTRDLNPWTLDLVELVGRFRAYVAERDLELAVPGRMVLASSVLLRMKSDWVRDGGAPPTMAEALDEITAEIAIADEEEPAPVYIAPELCLPIRRQPRSRPTLADLRRSLKAALAKQGRSSRPAANLTAEDMGMDVEREPFTRRVVRLLRYLLTLVNGQRVIPFQAVAPDGDPKERVARFLELLHLDAQGKIRVFQEEFLGEILIEVPDGRQGPG